MSTLNGVKYTEKWVTEEELKVLELFKECEQVRFIRYDEKNVKEAEIFTDRLGESEVEKMGDAGWVTSKKGKISATSFFAKKD